MIFQSDRRVGRGRDPVHPAVRVPAVLVAGRGPGEAVRRDPVGAPGVPGAALGARVGRRHRPGGQHAAPAARAALRRRGRLRPRLDVGTSGLLPVKLPCLLIYTS